MNQDDISNGVYLRRIAQVCDTLAYLPSDVAESIGEAACSKEFAANIQNLDRAVQIARELSRAVVQAQDVAERVSPAVRISADDIGFSDGLEDVQKFLITGNEDLLSLPENAEVELF